MDNSSQLSRTFAQSLIFALIGIAIILSISIFNSQIVVAWHQDLGISDEEAAQLYQTNPNDPEIEKWKNALQKEIELIRDECLGGPADKQLQIDCDNLVKLAYSDCISHPNTLVACKDRRISNWFENTNIANNTVRGNNSDSFLLYKNKQGIQMEYPAQWELKKTPELYLIFLSPIENETDTFRENLKISNSPSEGQSLKSLSDSVDKYYESSLSEYRLLKLNDNISVSGDPAVSLTYTFEANGQSLKATDIATIKGDKLCVFQYIASNDGFDYYLPTIQKMVNSFEIIK